MTRLYNHAKNRNKTTNQKVEDTQAEEVERYADVPVEVKPIQHSNT